MRKLLLPLSLVCSLLFAGEGIAQEVKTYYDQYQNTVADVALGFRYDKPDETSQDSVFMMYLEGGQFPGYADVVLVAVYDADSAGTDKPSGLSCVIKRESPLYEGALEFLTRFNGASTFSVSAESGVLSECLSFDAGADSTRKAQLQKAWQPFWLYDFQQDATGAKVKRFQGSFTPYVLSNGVMVRGVQIQYLPTQYGDQSKRIALTAFDDSIVGEGPVFASSFKCLVDAYSPVYHVYQKLANASSRHLVFNVERYAESEKCHNLSLVLNSQSFELE